MFSAATTRHNSRFDKVACIAEHGLEPRRIRDGATLVVNFIYVHVGGGLRVIRPGIKGVALMHNQAYAGLPLACTP